MVHDTCVALWSIMFVKLQFVVYYQIFVDVKRVANILLNEAPNSNDATRVGNNVRLTAMGEQQFSMAAI